MTYYDIYCTNCETVQASGKNPFGTTEHNIGAALSDLTGKSLDEELCCYGAECMIDEHYVVRKAEEKVEYTRLDDA